MISSIAVEAIEHGSGGPRAGAMTALLEELARAPEVSLGAGGGPGPRQGDLVGRFEVRRELGQGGFGVVYEARDLELGRRVALKLLRPQRRAGELAERALHSEAEAVAQLHHPNIVTLHDVGTSPAGPFLVFELLEGEPLAARLARGTLPTEEAVRVGTEVARAVAHAHAHGVLHRDLKPANVFLCADGRVKVLDLGLSHLFGAAGPKAGTPGHMAPEQWRGQPEDGRTDVFALGVLLHQALSGSLPFNDGTGDGSVLGPDPAPPLPASVRSRRLRQLVGDCLAKEPPRRPATGGAVLERLLEVQRAMETREATRRARRRAWTALVAVAGLVAGFLGWRHLERARLPTGPVPVVVADFENATGEPELDALSGLLITSLEQSRRLTVMTRARMVEGLRQLGRSGTERVDEALGRELGRKSTASVLVVPAVHRLGDVYSVDLKLVEPDSDHYLFAAREQARGKEGIPELLDRLSDRIRAALRERSEEIRASRVSVGRAVTSRLDAYEQYFRGNQLAAAERPTEALAAYRQAVRIDPGFAQAHLAIAVLLRVVDPEQSRAALEAALRQVDRVPEKERLLIRAQEAGLDFRTEEALRLADLVRKRWPDDPEGHWLVGSFLIGQRADFARGLPLLERAVALDPGRSPSLIRVQLLGDRLDEALETATRFADRSPGSESLGLLTIVRSTRGEVGPALEAARRAFQAGAAPSLHVLHAYLRAGALAEAEAAVRERMAPATPALERRGAFIDLAVLQGARGRMRDAIRTLKEAERRVDGGTPSAYLSWARAFLLGGLGDGDGIWAAARAQRAGGFGGQACNAVLLADLGQRRRAEALLDGYAGTPCASIVRAVGAWREGRRDEALAGLERLRFPLARYYHGKLLLEAGRDQEALPQLRRFQNEMSAWLPFFAWAYPESLYLSAEAQARLGDREAARQELGRLAALWSDPDPDLALLGRVRELRARLEGGPVPASPGEAPPPPP